MTTTSLDHPTNCDRLSLATISSVHLLSLLFSLLFEYPAGSAGLSRVISLLISGDLYSIGSAMVISVGIRAT